MIVSTESEYTQFKQVVSPLLPVHLDFYKQQQMERRIRDLARKHQAPSLCAYGQMVKADAGLLSELEQHITINVSEFYRNPDAFERLRTTILPRLLDVARGVRVWSAGCSHGGEPYTIAMLLHEAAPQHKHSIHATDIDRAILDRARCGEGITREDIQHLPPRLRDRYLSRQGPPFTVAAELRQMVRFERHDLLRDKAAGPYDLIACRNVVIYFTDEAKQSLYETFVQALRPGGYLFIGATEVIGATAQLGLRYVAPCFYVKAGA